MKLKEKKGIFSKIESHEDALKTIKDCALAFFFLAVLQAGIGYFVAPSLIIDAVLYAVLAAIMLKWNSRVAAVSLLIFSCFVIYMTIRNRLGLSAEGGNNIFLAAIVLWAAIRSVQATFKVNSKRHDV